MLMLISSSKREVTILVNYKRIVIVIHPLYIIHILLYRLKLCFKSTISKINIYNVCIYKKWVIIFFTLIALSICFIIKDFINELAFSIHKVLKGLKRKSLNCKIKFISVRFIAKSLIAVYSGHQSHVGLPKERFFFLLEIRFVVLCLCTAHEGLLSSCHIC